MEPHARHLSPRTERSYVGWTIRYIRYHGMRHPTELVEPEIVAFLTHLAAEQMVSRSTQMQALSALQLLYGAGPRLMECLTLRVKDLEFARGKMRVQRGKRGKDRITMLPKVVRSELEQHLARVRALHERDVCDGGGRVEMPAALDRKAPSWALDFTWR